MVGIARVCPPHHLTREPRLRERALQHSGCESVAIFASEFLPACQHATFLCWQVCPVV